MHRFEVIWKLSPFKKAILGSSVFIGFALGALSVGTIMDKKGRKYTFSIGCFLFLIFGVASSFATEYIPFLFLRVLVGFSIGILIPTNQAFLTENVPSNLRGFCSILIWLGFSMGEMYICFVASFYPLDDLSQHHYNWSYIVLFAALPIILNFILMNWIHESPRFALSKFEYENAFRIIDQIQWDSNKASLSFEEKKMIMKQKEFEHEKNGQKHREIDITTETAFGKNFKTQTIALWVMWFIVSYIFYGVIYLIPELLGKNKKDIGYNSLLHAVIFSTVFEIVGIFLSFIMEIKLIGRLGCFRISFGITILLSLGSLFRLNNSNFLLHIIKGSIQLATRALYIYTSEVYPTEIRGKMLGLSNVITRIAALVTPIAHEILIMISPKISILNLGLFAAIGFIASIVLKVETLGKSLK
jgi:MFS family permease